jgi:hypothetical protein
MISCDTGDLEKPFLMPVEGVLFAMTSSYFPDRAPQTSFRFLAVVPSLLVVLSVASLPKGLKLRSSDLAHTLKLHSRALVRTKESSPESPADRDQRCFIRNWTEYAFIKVSHRFMLKTCQGEAGDNMGALLRGVKREQMKRGQVIIAPGSMKPTTKFQAQIYVRTVSSWIQFVNLNPFYTGVDKG